MTHAADRTMQIAVEMEKLGRTFYESLAQGCGDPGIAALARQLARDEKNHVEVFSRMLDALPDAQRGPALTETELFDAAAALRVKIMPGAAAVRDAVIGADIGKVLDMAIDMEAQAAAFYSGEARAAAGMDSAALARIADEEKKHLTILRDHRGRLDSPRPSGA
jgi:rubrerythrin